jgi:putative ABC transport system substrate-binding protein
MTNRFCRLAVALLLAGTLFPAAATSGRAAATDAESGESIAGDRRGTMSGTAPAPRSEMLRPAGSGEREKAAAQLPPAGRPAVTIRLAAAGAGPGPIAVLYPDIGEPYRSVFFRIIAGIEERTRNKVAAYAIGGNFNAQELSGELRRQEIQVVIALGRNGLKAAAGLDKDIGIVVGGIISAPESDTRGSTVLSLAPDPALLFARLKSIAPRTQRVHVVYDPRQNGWLIRLAQEAARTHGIELLAQEASDLKTALTLYQQILAGADPRRDALWLPQDSATVDESTVLPLVLQESWAKSLVVFSSSISHVRRGALFALYPDNAGLGRQLAESALGIASGTPAGRNPQPLRDVLTAFNTRTASHLGIGIPPAQQRTFDLLFPEQ